MSDSDSDQDSGSEECTYSQHEKLTEEDSDFEKDVGDFPDDADIQAYKRVKRYCRKVNLWTADYNTDILKWFRKHNIPRFVVNESILIFMYKKDKESFQKKETWEYHISVERVGGECAFLLGEKVKGSKALQNVFLIDDWVEKGRPFKDRYTMDRTKAKQIHTWDDVDKNTIWGRCLNAVLNDWVECKKIFKDL